jgi:hypothetical protein
MSADKSSEKSSYHFHHHPNNVDQELKFGSKKTFASWVSRMDDEYLKPFLIYKYDRSQK